jgi:ankyrin repeat protein
MNLKDIMMLFGKTPLRAALYADIEITRLLIKYGANLNLRLPDRSTVLHDAAKMGRPDHIEVLVEHGAKIDTRDRQGRTPLAVALSDTWNIGFDSYKDPVPTLLQKGALIRNLAWSSNAQKTAAELGVWMEAWPLSVLFLGFLVHFPLSPETKQGNNATLLDSATELHLAAIGSATFKNRLLSGLVSIDGIDLDAKDGLSLTPLEYAAICDETENMRTLIQAGADIHCTDENGLTLLHRAVLADRTGVIKTLIEEGEDINVRIIPPADLTADLPTHSELSDNDERWQPLVIATYSAKARLTPLQLAVLANRKDVITTLLDLKADLCAYAYPVMPVPWMAMRHSDDLYATLVAADAPIRPGDVSAAAQLSVLRKEEPGKEDRSTRLFMDYFTQCVAAGITVPPMTNYPNSEDMVEKGILAFAGLAERVWLREVSTCVMMVVVTAVFGKEELGFDDEEEEEVLEPPSPSSLTVEPDRGWRRAS